MKSRLTMRAALAAGLPALARGIGRVRRWHRTLLTEAGHQAGRGNILTAAGLVLLHIFARA